jgi:hypothetical protein
MGGSSDDSPRDTVPAVAALMYPDDKELHQKEWAEGRRYLGLDVFTRARVTLIPGTQSVRAGVPYSDNNLRAVATSDAGRAASDTPVT